MARFTPHPDQLSLDWRKDPENEAQAFWWRLRLIVIEAGIALKQPFALVKRSGAMVTGACFLNGMLLIGMSGAIGALPSRLKRKSR